MLSFSHRQKVGEMPVNPASLPTRYSSDNHPVYKDFCSFFVSGVVGIRNFDRHKCHIPYSKNVSISDEAFAVLTLESNWSRWSSMADANEWKDSDVPSKWTTSKDKRKLKSTDDDDNSGVDEDTPQARRYRGWSAQGIARFNQLATEIKRERAKESFSDFETYCMEEFQKEADNLGLNKTKRRKTEPLKPLPAAFHELFDNENNGEIVDEEITLRMPAGLQHLGTDV